MAVGASASQAIFDVIRSTSSHNGTGFAGTGAGFVSVGQSAATGNGQLGLGNVFSYGDNYTADVDFPISTLVLRK